MTGLLAYPNVVVPRRLLGYPKGLGDVLLRRPPVAGYAAWFDAADVATLTVNASDLVSQWDDKSGNDRHLLQRGAAASGGSESTKPGYGRSRLRRIGGITVVDFDGGDYMDSPYDVSADAWSSLFVAVTEALNSTDFYWGNTNYGAVLPSVVTKTIDSAGTSGGFRVGVETGGANASAARAVAGQPFAFGVSCDGGTDFRFWKGRLNEAIVGTSPAALADGLRVGGRGAHTPAYWLAGGIGEMLFYDRTLDPQEMGDTIEYLMQKWGIAGP